MLQTGFTINSGKTFKSYTNYKNSAETRFVDALLGAGVIFLALYLILEVF